MTIFGCSTTAVDDDADALMRMCSERWKNSSLKTVSKITKTVREIGR